MYKNSSPATIDQGIVIEPVYFYGLDQNLRGFVLTPACDFAQNKAELVQICALFPAPIFIGILKETKWPNKGANAFRSFIRNIIAQKVPRYHWLSPHEHGFPEFGLIADFQTITSIPLNELDGLNLIAELASPFREELPARYAAYVGRVGTPDFNKEDVELWTEAIIDGLHLDG